MGTVVVNQQDQMDRSFSNQPPTLHTKVRIIGYRKHSNTEYQLSKFDSKAH